MEFRILNSKTIKAASFEDFPYRLGMVKNILQSNQQQLLLDSFPEQDFELIRKEAEQKSYNMYLRSGVKKGTGIIVKPDQLSETWIALLKEFQTDTYRQLISSVTNIPLDNCLLEINFWKYSNGSFLDVHVDKKEKVVTHLIYLSEYWNPDWGGCFRIHLDGTDQSVYRTILPTIDQSILLINSKKAWHSVEPVYNNTVTSRKGVQIIFWKEEQQ